MSDSSQSGFRDFLRFSFPSSSWAAASAYPADSGDGPGGSFPQQDDGCSYTKLVRSRCFLDHNSDGKPVKKCEKTEQLLRNCIGKAQEIVESKSESTEEEVTDGWSMEASNEVEGPAPFSPESFLRPRSPWNPLEGMDPFSRGLSDGLESFMQAAEEMMNDVFNQLGFYRQDGGSVKGHFGRSQKMFPESRSKGNDVRSVPPENTPHNKVDFGDSRSFDEV